MIKRLPEALFDMSRAFQILILFIAFSSFAPSANARDSVTAGLAWFHRFEDAGIPFPNTFSSTIWGYFQKRYHSLIENLPYSEEPFQSNPVHIKSMRFGKNFLTVFMTLRKDEDLVPIKAPLIIVLPGIFEDGQGPLPSRLCEDLWERGNHVVVIPNPWSAKYLRHRPMKKPGDVSLEAQTALEVIRGIQEKIGIENIDSTSLVAESYGALLGTAVYALDQRSKAPLITGKALVMSPPIHLGKSAERIDQGMDRTEASFEACFRISVLSQGVKYLLLRETRFESQLPKKFNSCMEAYVFKNFRDALGESSEAIRDYFKRDATDVRNAKQEENGKILEGIRFDKSFHAYNSANLPLLTSKQTTLPYWANLIPDASLKRFTIIASKDDFINSPTDWTTDASPVFQAPNLFLLSWGGHLGFEGTPAFQEYLDIAFAPDAVL